MIGFQQQQVTGFQAIQQFNIYMPYIGRYGDFLQSA
jgi:hypothetical protein